MREPETREDWNGVEEKEAALVWACGEDTRWRLDEGMYEFRGGW